MKTYKSENRIQQECYMWFHNTYPHLRGCLFAVPNGGARSALEGKLFKMTGVVRGVSDMLLMVNGETTCFELKTEVGSQSVYQVAWQKQIESQGFKYFIIRDVNLFKQIVKSILKNATV
jgi:hypothetical protein